MKQRVTMDDLVGKEVSACINHRGRDLATVRGILRKRIHDDGFVVNEGLCFAWPDAESEIIKSGTSWRIIHHTN